MKAKKRYLSYKIEGQNLDEKTLKTMLRKAVSRFIGEMGSSEANAKLFAFNAPTNEFVLRCATGQLEQVIAAITLITSYNFKPLALRLQGMSGSIKHVWSY